MPHIPRPSRLCPHLTARSASSSFPYRRHRPHLTALSFSPQQKNAAPLDFSPPAPYINRQDTSKGADMEIEYIYPDPKDDRDLDAQLKKCKRKTRSDA